MNGGGGGIDGGSVGVHVDRRQREESWWCGEFLLVKLILKLIFEFLNW